MHPSKSTLPDRPRRPLSLLPVLLLCGLALSVVLAASAVAEAVGELTISARQTLERARTAALAVESVSYRFVNGHERAPFGWVDGTVVMERRGDSPRMRVEGTFHDQPMFGRSGFDFVYTVDEREASEWRSDTGKMVVASLTNDPLTAAGLAVNASYGFLPELVEAKPYWKELDLATQVEMAGTTTIDGVECDVVRTEMAGAHGPTYQDWYFERDSGLPRGLLWWMEARGMRAEMPFSMLDLEVGKPVAAETFRLEAPEGAQVVHSDFAGVRLGDPAPDWTLKDPEGKAVRLADHRGEVVVLDFWNTGCYLCHNALPQIDALATALADQPVTFLALDVWEQGNPVAYWSERGFSPRLLLDANDVAAQYGVTGQPAVVVVGPEGEVLHAQIGFTADRTQRVREAIEKALGSSTTP